MLCQPCINRSFQPPWVASHAWFGMLYFTGKKKVILLNKLHFTTENGIWYNLTINYQRSWGVNHRFFRCLNHQDWEYQSRNCGWQFLRLNSIPLNTVDQANEIMASVLGDAGCINVWILEEWLTEGPELLAHTHSHYFHISYTPESKHGSFNLRPFPLETHLPYACSRGSVWISSFFIPIKRPHTFSLDPH